MDSGPQDPRAVGGTVDPAEALKGTGVKLFVEAGFVHPFRLPSAFHEHHGPRNLQSGPSHLSSFLSSPSRQDAGRQSSPEHPADEIGSMPDPGQPHTGFDAQPVEQVE